MDEKLDELIRLQKEQNDLLRKHLLRLRFSIRTLLVLTTLICLFLGAFCFIQFWIYRYQAKAVPATSATLSITGAEEGTSAPATTTDGVFRVFSNQDTLRLGTQSAPTDTPQFNLEPAQTDANDLFDTIIGEKK